MISSHQNQNMVDQKKGEDSLSESLLGGFALEIAFILEIVPVELVLDRKTLEQCIYLFDAQIVQRKKR